jgi:hypothetical protein
MTFVGVMILISGILEALTCVGIPLAILLIIAGVSMLGAKTALQGVGGVDPQLSPFFTKLKTYVMVTGIFYILAIALVLIVVLLYFSVIVAALSSGEWNP